MSVLSALLSRSPFRGRHLVIALCISVVTLSTVVPMIQAAPSHEGVTPETAQSTTSPPPETATNQTVFPPGTTEAGITNVTRLIGAHRSALNTTNHTANLEWDYVTAESSRESTGFTVLPLSITSTSGENRSLVRLDDEVVNTYWVTDNATAVKTSVESAEVQSAYYSYQNNPQRWEAAMSETLHQWVNTSTYVFTGTFTRNNRTLYEFWATGLRGNATPVQSAHARMLVDRNGLIHDVIMTRTLRRGNHTMTARLNYSVQGMGTAAPTRPDWVTEDLPHLDAEAMGNGTVIALEHRGGMTIGNATISTYIPGGPEIRTQIAGFEPGETLYLYRTQDDPDRILLSESEAPAINESLAPVGDNPVGVSVFGYPTYLSGGNEFLSIEIEPSDS